MNTPAVIYARVSSREQEREGYSIPAQIKLLNEYAQREGLEVVNTFQEAETAKSSGREEFGHMLAYLKNNPTVKTILVEKTDRLYRNFKDYVLLEELDVAVHFVKEGEILSKDSHSHVKFIHGIKVLMAKNYIDNLSEEVKKGQLEKARQGYYPLAAPFGYRTDKELRMMVPDEPKAKWVRRMYELYGSGQYSLSSLREQLFEEGMRFRPSQPKIHKSTLAKMLQNVIYTGDFYFKDKFYHGKHEPLVSVSLFEATQQVFEQANRPKNVKHQFMFSGLLTCKHCGCAVTPQMQKKKYIYYHCTQGRGVCSGKYVREEVLAEQMEAALHQLSANSKAHDEIIPILKSHHQEEIVFHESRVSELRQRHDSLTRKIELVYEDKLDGKIPEELWFRKHEQYKTELNHIDELLKQHKKGNLDYVESGIRLLELAKNAYQLYEKQNQTNRRRLLASLLSNCTFEDGKLDVAFVRPFDLFAKVGQNEKWSG